MIQVERSTDHLPHEYIQLLKTQDLAYVHMKKALDEKVRQRSPFTLYIVSSLSLTMHMDMALVITESGEAAQQPAPADQPAGEQAHDLRGEAGGCGGLRPRGAFRHRA